MHPDFKFSVLIDDRIESYKSFFDHEWAGRLTETVRGTKIDEAVFLLTVNWKAAANAQFMPSLMMTSIQNFEKGYLRSQPTFTDKLLKDMSESFGNFLKDEISNTLNKKLTKKIRAFIVERQKKCDDFLETVEWEDTKPQALFRSFLLAEPGGSELQLSVYGAQRVCYAAIFFEYEHFLKSCVRILKNKPKHRPSNWDVLHGDIKFALDETTANKCCYDDPVKTGRLLRNCIAHNGGQLTDEGERLPKGSFRDVGGFVGIMPEHNRALFSALKDRVTIMTEATLARLA